MMFSPMIQFSDLVSVISVKLPKYSLATIVRPSISFSIQNHFSRWSIMLRLIVDSWSLNQLGDSCPGVT